MCMININAYTLTVYGHRNLWHFKLSMTEFKCDKSTAQNKINLKLELHLIVGRTLTKLYICVYFPELNQWSHTHATNIIRATVLSMQKLPYVLCIFWIHIFYVKNDQFIWLNSVLCKCFWKNVRRSGSKKIDGKNDASVML